MVHPTNRVIKFGRCKEQRGHNILYVYRHIKIAFYFSVNDIFIIFAEK